MLGKGMEPLGKNFLIRGGQLDLIFQDKQDQTVHFIEVKSRLGNWEDSDFRLSIRQMMVLERTAGIFLNTHGLSTLPWQFDLIWINFSRIENSVTAPHTAKVTSASQQALDNRIRLKANIKYLPNVIETRNSE